MKIILYVFTGENIEVNKQAKLTQALERDNCTFRKNINISAPIIYLEFTDDIIDIPYNYCYIEGTNKYYFIRNKIRISKTLWSFELDIDVLYTYRSQILENEAFIGRNENLYNPFIIDDLTPFTKEKTVEIRLIENVTNSDVVNTEFNSDISNAIWNIVITSSDLNYQSKIDIQAPSPILSTLKRSYTNLLTNYHIVNGTAPDLYNYLKGSNVSGFIKAIIMYPCEIKRDFTEDDPLTINGIVSTVPSYKPEFTPTYFMTVGDFIISDGVSFLDYEPITTYEMYIPFVGYVQLNAHEILGRRLLLIYQPNFEDGSASVFLIDKNNNNIVYQSTCQLGVNIGLSTDNELENNRARISNTLNLITGGLSSVLSGDKKQFGLGMINNIGNYIVNDLGNYVRGNAVINSGVNGMLSPLKPHLKITRGVQPNTDYETSNFESLYGKPLNAVKKLSNLTGFTTILNIHLKNISGATYTEIEIIEQLLKSGVIL